MRNRSYWWFRKPHSGYRRQSTDRLAARTRNLRFEQCEDRRMLANGIATIEFTSVPTSVAPGELVDIGIQLKLSGNTQSGPWDLNGLGLYDEDPLGTWTTIEALSDSELGAISAQDTWYTYTFSDVPLSNYDDGGDGIELYAYVAIDDNTSNLVDATDSTSIHQVTVNYPALQKSLSSMNFGNSATSSTFQVRNSGSGTLSYSISDNASWLSVSPTTGSSTGEWDTINVYVNRSGLSPNTYTGTITIDPSAGSNQTISLSMIVVDTTPPTTPSLTSPSNGLETNDNTVSLDWSDSTDSGGSGLAGYDVQVDNSSAFSSPEYSSSPSGSSATTSSLADGLYYWRVRSRDNAGNSSAWTSARTFRVDTTAPSFPTLISPVNGASTTNQRPTFDWNDVADSGSGLNHYQLQVYDGDITWGDIDVNTTGSSYVPTQDIPFDRVYWRVRAIDDVGNTSAWSTESFLDVVPGSVTSLSWRNAAGDPISSIYAGQTVYLRADASGMNGQTVSVDVWEDDGVSDNKIVTKSITIGASGYGTVAWISTWQGDDQADPFNLYYLHEGTSGVYSGTVDTGHFLVKPPTQNIIAGAVWSGMNSIAVSIKRVDDASKPIETEKTTWIVTHGFNSDVNTWVNDLTDKIADLNQFWQVLVIDWSDGLSLLSWVKEVGSWAGTVLSELGVVGTDLNLIGHSWGSYVMDELAETIGGANTIVGLDPGAILVGQGYSTADVDFAAHSQWSLAFHSSDILGNEITPATADRAFAVQVDEGLLPPGYLAHTSIHELFGYMIFRNSLAV
jgi:pimeloyl-ACP methyl ester carboxylesterase